MIIATEDDKTWVELIVQVEGYIFGVSSRAIFYTALAMPLYLLLSSDWPAYVAGLLIGWYAVMPLLTWSRDLAAAKHWVGVIALLIGLGFSLYAICVTSIINMEMIKTGLKSLLG